MNIAEELRTVICGECGSEYLAAVYVSKEVVCPNCENWQPAPIYPQPGPQMAFLSTRADIAVMGGAAYGGKSWALLLDALRGTHDPNYTAVLFRRESTQITAGGGLWDSASHIFPNLGGEAQEYKLTYNFPSKAKIKFTHLQHEADKFSHQGAQYVFQGWDELEHFSESQFWYLYSRNRPPAGCALKPYVRGGTNPNADSWTRELIDWWIDPETGFAIPERSGVLRYFTRVEDEIVWVDETWKDSEGNGPKSLTFIPSYVDDNPLGMISDPTYKSTLKSLDKVQRERLLKGNWNITYKGGMFDPTWFKIVQNAPPNVKWIRYWDRAATAPKDENDDPDWNAGVLCGMYQGSLYIKDVVRFRENPAECEKIIKQTADDDGKDVIIGFEVEPGSAGKEVANYYQTKVLRGYTVLLDRPKGNKVERCRPWCALAEHGNVKIVKGDWNRPFLGEAGNFPFGKKDQIDGVSGAYKVLTMEKYVWQFQPGSTTKVDIDWNASEGRPTLHYGTMVQLKDLSLWFLEMLWDNVDGLLYIYGAWTMDEMDPEFIAKAIIQRMQLRKYRHERILCNDQMASNEGHVRSPMYVLRREFTKYNLNGKLIESLHYNEAGGIALGQQMFAHKQIIVDDSCIEVAQQLAGWIVAEGKPQKNNGYCIGLCMVLCELQRRKLVKKPKIVIDYKAEKKKLDIPTKNRYTYK